MTHDTMTLDLGAPPPAAPSIRRRHVDARQACRSIDLPRFDLVMTDPPYNSLNRHIEAGGTTVRLREFFETLSNDDVIGVLAALARRLRPGGFMLVAANWEAAYGLARADGVEYEGLKGSAPPVGQVTGIQWRVPWVWVKTKRGSEAEADELGPEDVRSGMGYYGRQAHEEILVLQAPGTPDPYVTQQLRRTANVIPAPVVLGKGAYPTEKPAELGSALLRAFCPRGGLVIDPFAGSGRWVTGPALEQGLSAEVWDVSAAAPAVRP